MGLIIAGIACFLVGVGLFFAYRSAKAKLLDMASAETFTAASLKETADAVAKEIGAGSFNQIAEVKGMIGCNIPLTSEITKQPCVYYSSRIVEEYEEEYYERDQQGHNHRRTRKHTHTVLDNSRWTDFFLQDQTGKIQISAKGADWDPISVCSEVRQTIPQHMHLHSGARYLGSRHSESIVPVGKMAYILGQARDEGGLSIRKPDGDKRFLISLKSEEELAEDAKGSMNLYRIASPIVAIIGIILLVAGIVTN